MKFLRKENTPALVKVMAIHVRFLQFQELVINVIRLNGISVQGFFLAETLRIRNVKINGLVGAVLSFNLKMRFSFRLS